MMVITAFTIKLPTCFGMNTLTPFPWHYLIHPNLHGCTLHSLFKQTHIRMDDLSTPS